MIACRHFQITPRGEALIDEGFLQIHNAESNGESEGADDNQHYDRRFLKGFRKS